jgi:hypothetical protein
MDTRTRLAVAAALLAGALASGAPAPANQGAACSWPTTLSTFNFAYPDTSAEYWMTHFGRISASRLTIRGWYPHARYFSFHAYDEAQRPVASLADRDIRPDRGSVNPFVARGAESAPRSKRRYTVHVVFEPPPKDPKRNTIYAGEMDNGAPNPAGFVVYRIYIPDDRKSQTGGVPLPQVSLETAGGAVELPLERCTLAAPPGSDAVDERIRRANYTYVTERGTEVPGVENPPLWKRFYGTDREFRDWVEVPGEDQFPKSKSGFLANHQVAYLYARISREFTDFVVVRLKTPTFPDSRAGEPVTSPRQLRYWSVCQNNALSQRVVACIPDYKAAVGPDGFATFVVSDPRDRPANATRRNGVNWLPWGGAYYEGVIIYRHMLPARSFREAVQNIPEGTEPGKVMDDFMPAARYCTKKRFESGGWGACS